MPRPRPLTNVTAYVSTEQQLTPRTPHNVSGTRTGRLEQGFQKLPLAETNEPEYDDTGTLQSAPLLASSSSARFSTRGSRRPGSPVTKGNGKRPLMQSVEMLQLAVSRLPLVFGIFMGGILLILIVLSFTRPEALHRYVGAKAPPAVPSPTARPTTSIAEPKPKVQLISYENYTTFPLEPHDYLLECAKQHVGYMAHADYWDISPMGAMDVEHHDDEHGDVCSKTITYMLDGKIGLVGDLALMAQVAAMARERNRTFFVDDTYWNRGKWLDHFEDVTKAQPGPEPGCKPPPPNELVACPRTARHWLVNSRTAKFHLGHAFSDHYEDPYQHALTRLKPIFKSAAHSLESAIRPNRQNMDLIQLARHELSAFLQDESQQIYVSAHVRKGDRKSSSYSFPGQKIPLRNYVDAVTSTWTRLHPGALSHINPVVYLATDSPYAQEEFSDHYKGKTYSLFDATSPRLRALASPAEYYQADFDEYDLETRVTATRGMVVDLAIVSGLWAEGKDTKPDAVICALSSTICKVSAIGLGWDKAFGNIDAFGTIDETHKRWVDIDERGQVVPVWSPFELY